MRPSISCSSLSSSCWITSLTVTGWGTKKERNQENSTIYSCVNISCLNFEGNSLSDQIIIFFVFLEDNYDNCLGWQDFVWWIKFSLTSHSAQCSFLSKLCFEKKVKVFEKRIIFSIHFFLSQDKLYN